MEPIRVGVAQVPRQLKLIVQFVSRADSDVKEARVVSSRATASTLGNIGWDRDSAAPHLSNEPEPFGGWEGPGRMEDVQRQLVSSIPNVQPSKVTHTSTDIRVCVRMKDS